MSDQKPFPWVYGETPPQPGFYPTLLCWDAEEGVSLGANRWDGEQWEGPTASAVVAFIAEPFDDAERAVERAYESDPDV